MPPKYKVPIDEEPVVESEKTTDEPVTKKKIPETIRVDY